MGRTFLYRYLGEAETQTVVKPDPDEAIAIPEKGEIMVRNGKYGESFQSNLGYPHRGEGPPLQWRFE